VSRLARYTVTVYVDVAMDDDADEQDYVSRKAKDSVERDIIHTFEQSKRIGEKIDAECTDVEVVTT